MLATYQATKSTPCYKKKKMSTIIAGVNPAHISSASISAIIMPRSA